VICWAKSPRSAVWKFLPPAQTIGADDGLHLTPRKFGIHGLHHTLIVIHPTFHAFCPIQIFLYVTGSYIRPVVHTVGSLDLASTRCSA